MSEEKKRKAGSLNPQWLENPKYKKWLKFNANGKAYCTYCKESFGASRFGEKALEGHMEKQKHQNATPSTSQRSPNGNTVRPANEAEKQPNKHKTESSPSKDQDFKVQDNQEDDHDKLSKDEENNNSNFGEDYKEKVLEDIMKYSETQEFQKEILKPASHFQDHKFSLFICEETRSFIDYFLVLVRFFNDFEILDEIFIDELPIQDAATLYQQIINNFEVKSILYKSNMIGFAADGGNATLMELADLFKQDICNLHVVKFVFNSFHLCSSQACMKLPKELEDLIRNIYNYFHASPDRSSSSLIQKFRSLKPYLLCHPRQTQWLSVRSAVTLVLEEHKTLVDYFTNVAQNEHHSAPYEILTLLKKSTTKAYLEFLEFSLEIFEDLEKVTQSKFTYVHKLHDELSYMYKKLLDYYMNPSYIKNNKIEDIKYDIDYYIKPLADIFFGSRTELCLNDISHHNTIKQFKSQCIQFYKEGAKQILKRYDFKDKISSGMSFLKPDVMQQRDIQSLVETAKLYCLAYDETISLDIDWRKLRDRLIQNPKEDISEDIETYWKHKTMYPHLRNFIMAKVLCLPYSTAKIKEICSRIDK